MKYISTRGATAPVGFHDAVMMGLARDGGLLLPERIPRVGERLQEWSELEYRELACAVMELFTDLPEAIVAGLVARSYDAFRHPEVTPVVQVGDIYILELFHGPTLAFKDIALQFLGNLFEYMLEEERRRLNIVVATSGDTGSAAIFGVKGRPMMRVFVMHPRGRISPTQERQMTSVPDDNVFNMAIEGTFDDCQAILKTLFSDLEFKDRCALGSVNSINWARVLAQIVYYFYAGLRVMRDTGAEKVRFSVPTGNFGDIFAGYLAARMGLPVSRLILATNENNILARFFETGVYRAGPVQATISPSMDVQVASNFERYLYYVADEDAARLRDMMEDFREKGSVCVDSPTAGAGTPLFIPGSGNTASTLKTIRDFHEKYVCLLDPHTAVGVHVGRQHLAAGEPLICLATAHPAKFGAAIRNAVGRDVARHPIIDGLRGLPTRCAVLPASVPAVKEYIEQTVVN